MVATQADVFLSSSLHSLIFWYRLNQGPSMHTIKCSFHIPYHTITRGKFSSVRYIHANLFTALLKLILLTTYQYNLLHLIY